MKRHNVGASSVVVGSSVHRWPRGLWLVLIVLIIVGGCLVAGYYYMRHKTSSPPLKTPAISAASRLQAAQNELSRAQNDQQKAAAETNLGAAYLENQQPAAAIRSYQTALSETHNVGSAANKSADSPIIIYSQLITAYSMMGQTSDEIHSIQQLIPLLQASSDPADRAIVGRYEQLIDKLQRIQQGQ